MQFRITWQPLSAKAISHNLDPDVLPLVQPRERLGCPESEAGHDASLVRVLPILRPNRSLAAGRSLVRNDPPPRSVYLGAHPLHHSHHFGHFARNSSVLFASHLHLIMTPTVLPHSAIIHSGHDQGSKERGRTQRNRTGGRKEKRKGEGERRGPSLSPSQTVSPPQLR